MIINKDVLNQLGANSETIEFCESNNLFGIEPNDEVWDKIQSTMYNKIKFDSIEFDFCGNVIFYVKPNGVWVKMEYENGAMISYKESTGFWEKSEYNEDGCAVYYRNSYGFWWKREYENGIEVSYKNSKMI